MAYPESKVKANQCMFVLYPESQQAIINYVQTNFPCAWAMHDKDVWHQSNLDKWNRQNSDLPFPHRVGELKKPHVHFICKFPKSGRYFHAIAKELGVPVSTINRCANLFQAYEYLTHRMTRRSISTRTLLATMILKCRQMARVQVARKNYRSSFCLKCLFSRLHMKPLDGHMNTVAGPRSEKDMSYGVTYAMRLILWESFSQGTN